MNEAPTLSPSQLELWRTCNRRWGFTYLEGMRPPGNDAAQAGTEVHALLETYLRDGKIPDRSLTWKQYAIGNIAHLMCEELPPAGSVPTVEVELALEAGGVKYRGRVDARVGNTIFDHKTTSSLKYAKSAKVLENDLQALIYARWLDSDGELVWTYGQTKGPPKTRRVVLKVLRDEVRERFDAIVTPLAKDVLAAYAANDPNSLAKNLDSCNLYYPKGCDFRVKCMSFSERLREMNNTSKLTMAEKLAARAAGLKLLSPSTEPTSNFMPVTAPAQDKVIEAVQLINPPVDRITSTETAPDVLDVLKRPRRGRPPKAESDLEDIKHTLARGRRANIENTVALDTPPEAKPAEFAYRDTDPGPAPVPPIAGKPIRNLFLDCMPLNGKPVQGHVLIAKAAEIVCGDAQLHHVLLADFGKGNPMLAAELTAQVLAMDPGFDLVLITRTPEGRGVQQALMALSQNIVISL